ncbi:MAG: hypothetical protein WD805_02415 [Gaiellaceae bacterium]
MNALRNIHTALVPGGMLVDIHPIPPAEQAEAEGRVLGRIDEREFFGIVGSSEQALESCGVFELEAGVEHDVVERFDTVEEFFEIVGEREGTRIPARLASRVRASSPPIDLRERVAFRRLRAL